MALKLRRRTGIITNGILPQTGAVSFKRVLGGNLVRAPPTCPTASQSNTARERCAGRAARQRYRPYSSDLPSQVDPAWRTRTGRAIPPQIRDVGAWDRRRTL